MTSVNTKFRVVSMRSILLSSVYPKGEELVWVAGTIKSWDAGLVEVCLEDGTRGIGEVGAALMAALSVPGLATSFEPYLIGQEFIHPLEVGNHLRAFTTFWSRGGIANGVAGAIEIACIDAVGKREGVPAYELMGGLTKERIEVYSSGGLGTTFDEVLTWAEAQFERGFDTVKFRAMKDAETTLDLLNYVIPKLPAGKMFILDAVQGSASHPWKVKDSIRVGKAVAEHGGRWIEEPCFASDVAGFAEVKAAINCPVSGVESNSTVQEFENLILKNAVSIVQPDATIVGGLNSFFKVADFALAHDIACVPHTWGSSVTFMANLHAAFAHSHIKLFEYCTLPNALRDSFFREEVNFANSHLSAPTLAGLGVEITEEDEIRFQFRNVGGHVIR